jgi:hypothetical protein
MSTLQDVPAAPVMSQEPTEELSAATEPAVLPKTVSGVYVLSRSPSPLPFLEAAEAEAPPPVEEAESNGYGELALALPDLAPGRKINEVLRLDVDRTYPQMVVSGTITAGLARRLHWIARVKKIGQYAWKGKIFYKDGSTTLLPQVTVTVKVSSALGAARIAKVVFSGPGGTVTRVYKYSRASFHNVEFEYDSEQGQAATTAIDTHAHPNHPPGLPHETLTLERVYARAGFHVTLSAGGGSVPTSGAGPDLQWTDQEMHDAMQIHWSRFANAPRWAMWVFWARQHIQGTSLGGIMFDDIGPNHRQGTTIFNDSFIAVPPTGDPNGAAWVQRMLFWTAAHEMGHGFNLAHAWQKSLGTPWIPLADEPEARSFMNYPFRVSGGQSAFFADFAYRFTDAELLFLRHAPERFVQMGNADWFDHHGFEQANTTPQPDFELTLRMNRDKPELAFMEPANVELKLKNVSPEPQILEAARLQSLDSMTVIVKREGQPARRWQPYAHYCLAPELSTLAPGASLYQPLFIGAGTNGWLIDEPGRYLVQVAVHLNDRDVVSNPLQLRVRPPRTFEEEDIAQDMFSESVGRMLTFGGSTSLDDGNDALARVAAELGDHPAAIHARYALGNPRAARSKRVEIATGKAETNGHGSLVIKKSDATKEARGLVNEALQADANAAARTFGHILYRERVERYAASLPSAEGARAIKGMVKTLRARKVPAHLLDDGTATKG